MVMKKTVGEKIRSFRQQKKLTRALGITMSELFLDVPNNDSEIEVRQASIQHINYLLKDLSNEELDKITGILKEIIDWKKM